MINKLYEHFDKIENSITFLKSCMLFLVVIIIGLFGIYLGTSQYEKILDLFIPSISIVTAYSATVIADRLITMNVIFKEKDRESEIIRITHHFLTISYDLIGRVKYVKEIIIKGDSRPIFELTEIIDTIGVRYEMLITDKDAYRYLSSACTSSIYKMSDQIAGLQLLAVEAKTIQKSPLDNIHSSIKNSPEKLVTLVEGLISEMQNFIDELIKLRKSLES